MEFTTKEAFLLDALEYYTTDTNRRCTMEGVHCACYYSPSKVDKQGISEGCLIGRHLTDENKIKADNCSETSISTVINERPELIPKWMKNLNVSFLATCQNLHDINSCWVKNALSDKGKQDLLHIIQIYDFDKSQFQKYLN